MNDQNFMQALTAFEQSGMGAQAGAVAGAQAFNFCAVYKTVGPILKGIIPFVAALPGFGTAAAAGLGGLTAILDGVCQSQSTQAAVAGGEDQEFFQAVQAFQSPAGGAAISQSAMVPSSSAQSVGGGGGGTTSAQSLNVCGTWQQVGPILKRLIPAIKHIPVIGSRIATALQTLATALDALCPQSPAPATA